MSKGKEVKVDEVEEVEESTGASVTVTWLGSAQRPAGSRVYSKELHGKDYKDIAKGFAAKSGGKVA